LLLSNLIFPNSLYPTNISVAGENICATGEKSGSHDRFTIHFKYALVLPGLINSHDHLDFNCFQPLGEHIYQNYTEWGTEIHQVFKSNIQAVLNIPQNLRTTWGIYKNLLSGVTSVVHHGPVLPITNPLINVLQNMQNLHSTAFENNWKWKLNNPLQKNRPVVIHTGEGTDQQSKNEIDDLIKFNLIGRRLIGIHGVAMNPEQARKFKALVWCPESNKLLLDKQPDIKKLKKSTDIVFGTDSTLTGDWNFWHHLRFARSLRLTTEEELFEMSTKTPAALWNINSGMIKTGMKADLVVINKEGGAITWEHVFETNPEDILLIIQKGKIRLFDQSLLFQLQSHIDISGYSKVIIGDSEKYVEGDLPALAEKIKTYHQGIVLPFQYRENKLVAI
jgi:cytosine/adenosine deaminase-related metal-dependent hydrolase